MLLPNILGFEASQASHASLNEGARLQSVFEQILIRRQIINKRRGRSSPPLLQKLAARLLHRQIHTGRYFNHFFGIIRVIRGRLQTRRKTVARPSFMG